MTGTKDENERQLSAAPSTTSTTTPIDDTDEYLHQMMVRLSPLEDVVRRIRPSKFFRPNFHIFIILMINKHYFKAFNETTDPHGRPISWIPYGKDEFSGLPDLYPRYMVPVAVERYEIGYGVLPLPSTTTTTTTSTPLVAPTTVDEHLALLNSDPDTIPPHLALQFQPKLLRDGQTVKLFQWRFDEQQKKFCWQVFAQPIRPPTTTQVHPQLRISCPNLDKKYTFEDVIHFTQVYNLRPDGTYYRATPCRVADGRGYGPDGLPSPTAEGTYPYLLYQHYNALFRLKTCL